MVVLGASPVRSRLSPVRAPTNNSASGLVVKRCCDCSRSDRDTKETIHNGLLLIRVRYGLPYSELPDCSSGELGRFLAFLLLQGKERTSVAFPRRQVGKELLCNLQRLRRHERWELAHSVSSIKRNLPSGCVRHTPSPRKDWESYAVSQPKPPSSEYLQFVKAEVARILPSSWDRHYDSFVWNHLPNSTSRKPMLSRADLLWAGRRGEFVTSCLRESDEDHVFTARYKECQSAGKKRPLLIFDEKIELLAPLHKCLYSALQKCSWLLCGPPTDKRMTSVCVNRFQTSVDLIAATDGLSHQVSSAILDALFFTSVKIPRRIRRLAYAALSPVFLDSEGVHRRVRHGQMMGAYSSFPLLCIHSYVAARWAARFDLDARFLVNGDDCVISASRAVCVQDYPDGYRLNADKTIRAENVVEVNSTAFLRRGGKWRVVRHLRRGGATTDFTGMLHMASACCVGVPWVDAFQRARIGRRWGFLPSQLGHRTYPSYRRQMGMKSRDHTDLPDTSQKCSSSLVAYPGEEATPVEAEILRSHLWKTGREGGSKRDLVAPSCGSLRRTYAYRAQPCKGVLSFVGWAFRASFGIVKKPVKFLPEGCLTEKEELGLRLLDLYRQGLDSLVA
nr:MAG: RNA-dependent RNA polymerase [Mbeech associated botourmia-like virus 46]